MYGLRKAYLQLTIANCKGGNCDARISIEYLKTVKNKVNITIAIVNKYEMLLSGSMYLT